MDLWLDGRHNLFIKILDDCEMGLSILSFWFLKNTVFRFPKGCVHLGKNPST